MPFNKTGDTDQIRRLLKMLRILGILKILNNLGRLIKIHLGPEKKLNQKITKVQWHRCLVEHGVAIGMQNWLV